ncbi:hypothetical protein [Enterococcus mundtii]|uniref:hypothetical protein n=1 Tax=Enterococcus mundtii TaxID=53346 RepID=UPI001A95C51E|nr:hypothetical protein [Enterococcus mundtii]MBO1087185.1 hypothetical protein [Enterococcus mundtii]
MNKLTTRTFTDLTGMDLIIKYRKSAIFLMKRYEDQDLVDHPLGGTYIDGKGLKHQYIFSDETFAVIYQFLFEISDKCWNQVKPTLANSATADYDDYYDREFDNNGSLSIDKNMINISGCYAQPANEDKLTRLIKFDKRKFESFIYDFGKLI